MADDNLFLKLVKFYFFEGSSHSLHNNWEVLSPGYFILCFGGVGEVDEEALIVFEGILDVESRPDLMVVGPSLDKDYDVLRLLITLEVVFERLTLGHDT